MGLITILFNSQSVTGIGPVKAIVREEDLPFFESMAKVYRNASDIVKEVPPVKKTDPKKGHGRPGTKEWHVSNLNPIPNKGLVMEYARKVTGKEIDTKGTLTTVKETALKSIMEHMSHDSQGK